MSRFWDDLDLAAPDEYLPTMVQTLLTYLHVDDVPKKQQEDAVRSWMRGHPVASGSMMEFTMRRCGFGHLLDEPRSA